MSQVITPAPVRKSIRVSAPPDRAFAVFTADMTRWWPKAHSIGTAPLKEVIIEPRAGGRWFERGEDGSECQWGRVLAWEPPGRVLLAWQLTAQFRFDPAVVTELEIWFTPDGSDGTLVRLEHRNLERLGDAAAQARAALDGDGGWGKLLEAMAAAVAARR